MEILISNNPEKNEWSQLMKRPELNRKDLNQSIQEIFEEVKLNGDKALLKYTSKFDNVLLKDIRLRKNEIDILAESIPTELKTAINKAAQNIQIFHKSQNQKVNKITTSKGITCWQEQLPIGKVGLYIPGGSAPLFSTILMLAIPAKIAGCKEIILCTPPQSNGGVNPAIAYTAKLTGITKVFTIGGAQAIAAMSLGTETIPKVYKIFGPGNQYVTAAKQHSLTYRTAIDMPAGPSELLVICNKTSYPSFVAADLLSQAEHGPDSQVLCLSSDLKVIREVEKQIKVQIEKLPRKEIAKKAIANSKFIYFDDENDIIDFSNEYAPEHLIIAVEDYNRYVGSVENAGSVFLGNFCPESAGDYASGTNHTLPTAGYAKQYSGVNLDAFSKKITFQEISKKGILDIGKTIEIMAEAEGLIAHKNAVSIRLAKINQINEGN